jgi:hypothetical protein
MEVPTDGQDKRAIPVCGYAGLGLQSTTGLHEAYLLSNATATLAFTASLKACMAKLGTSL